MDPNDSFKRLIIALETKKDSETIRVASELICYLYRGDRALHSGNWGPHDKIMVLMEAFADRVENK